MHSEHRIMSLLLLLLLLVLFCFSLINQFRPDMTIAVDSGVRQQVFNSHKDLRNNNNKNYLKGRHKQRVHFRHRRLRPDEGH